MANVVYLVSPWRFLMFTLLKEYVTAVSIIAPKEIAKMWQKEACREPWNNNNGLRDPIPSFQGAMHVMVNTQVFATSPLQPWQIPLAWFSCLRHTYCEAGDGFRMNPGWFNRNVVHWRAALSKSMFDIVMDKVSKSEGPGLVPTSCLCHKEHRTAHTSDMRCFSITPRQLSVHPQHTLVMYHTALSEYTTHCPVCADCNGLCFICSGAHFELIGADVFLAASEAADLAGYISFFINCKCWHFPALA